MSAILIQFENTLKRKNLKSNSNKLAHDNHTGRLVRVAVRIFCNRRFLPDRDRSGIVARAITDWPFLIAAADDLTLALFLAAFNKQEEVPSGGK